jgi:CBS-domain-containing membrane protein
MLVENLMTREVRTCRAEDTLDAATRIFWEADCGCAPVVDCDGRVVGIVTDRDVAIAAYTQHRPLADIPVSVAMSRQVYSCGPQDTVASAEKVMRSAQVRRLPVVDAEGLLVGLISLNDIALEAARERSTRRQKEVSDAEVGETLASICAHRPTREPAAVA